MATTEETEALADEVKAFRARLLESGFTHANSAGELKNETGMVWVRTSYAGGEFQVDLWRRTIDSGHHEDHARLRVHPHSVEDLRVLGDVLVRYGRKDPSARTWKGLPVAS